MGPTSGDFYTFEKLYNENVVVSRLNSDGSPQWRTLVVSDPDSYYTINPNEQYA